VFLNRLGQTVERIGSDAPVAIILSVLSEQQAFRCLRSCASEMGRRRARRSTSTLPHACLNAVIKADETEKLAMDGEGKIRIERCLAAQKIRRSGSGNSATIPLMISPRANA